MNETSKRVARVLLTAVGFLVAALAAGYLVASVAVPTDREFKPGSGPAPMVQVGGR